MVADHGSVGGRAGAATALFSLLLLIAVMVLAGYRLFAGMTTAGMNGVDTFDYWRLANDALHGHYESDYDRLSLYAVNVLALKLLGVNDYAIRAFVGGFAVANIALVYLLGYLVARNAAVALAVAALYAFNPTVLDYAGTELPHITGATFVLLAALFALAATDRTAGLRTRLAASFMTGISVTAAALTHEDLAFLSVGYVIAIAVPIAMPRVPPAPPGRDLALLPGVFVLGSAAGAACLMAGFGVGPGKMFHDFLAVRAHFDENTALRTGGEFFQTVAMRIIRNFTVDTMGRVVTVLAAGLALVVAVAFAWRRCDRLKMLLTLEIPVLVYVAGFLGVARIYLEGSYQRLFIPLIGLTIVFAICGAYLLLRPLLRGVAAVAVVAWAAYVIVGNKPWNFAPPTASLHRLFYDGIKDRVTAERKLLLPACYAIGYPWVGIGSPVYLGDNVVPIYLMRDFVSFDTLIAENHVGYVYVPGEQSRGVWPRERIERLFATTYGVAIDQNLLKSLPPVSQEIWRGDTRVEWSGEACGFEAQILRRLLDERGARVALTVPNIGDIYELTR